LIDYLWGDMHYWDSTSTLCARMLILVSSIQSDYQLKSHIHAHCLPVIAEILPIWDGFRLCNVKDASAGIERC
jgi:hypothetical protein